MQFEQLNISLKLVKNLGRNGFTDLTPIQKETIPYLLDAKDLVGIAKTGSGKTLAYAIPIIDSIHDDYLTKLILVPTRELAMQVRNAINALVADYLRVVPIIGGVSQNKQIHDLKKGCQILVATPGRLNDLVNQNRINLSKVDTIVLDEADTMLDMGFKKQIDKIFSKINPMHQTVMFTATMSDAMQNLANTYLHDQVTIKINPTKDQIPQITEELYYLAPESKNDFLLSYLAENRITEALIFTKTKIDADKLCNYLNSYNLRAAAIHGDKRQGERSRNLKEFKSHKVNYLIATDIAARGIDIQGLPLVINYNVPDQAEVYVHRIGRTGRAGMPGKAITMATRIELNDLANVEKLINHQLPLVKDNKYTIEFKHYPDSNHKYNNHSYSHNHHSHHNRNNNHNHKSSANQ